MYDTATEVLNKGKPEVLQVSRMLNEKWAKQTTEWVHLNGRQHRGG